MDDKGAKQKEAQDKQYYEPEWNGKLGSIMNRNGIENQAVL